MFEGFLIYPHLVHPTPPQMSTDYLSRLSQIQAKLTGYAQQRRSRRDEQFHHIPFDSLKQIIEVVDDAQRAADSDVPEILKQAEALMNQGVKLAYKRPTASYGRRNEGLDSYAHSDERPLAAPMQEDGNVKCELNQNKGSLTRGCCR